MISESISYGGGRVAGFGVGVPGDAAFLTQTSGPDIYSTLTADQQAEVNLAFSIVSKGIGCRPTTGTPNMADCTCFQKWFNAGNMPPGTAALRTDGVFDQATSDALKVIVNSPPFAAMQPVGPGNCPSNFTDANGNCLPLPTGPGPVVGGCILVNGQVQCPSTTPSTGMSTGEIAGLALGGAALLGAIIYVVVTP